MKNSKLSTQVQVYLAVGLLILSSRLETRAAPAAPRPAAPPAATQAFLADLAAQAAAAEKDYRTAVKGQDGWLFFDQELRSLGAGRFWGDAAARVSRASNPLYADPLPAILDFKKQLDAAHIELLFVPVPPKAVIYPEMISPTVVLASGATSSRLDFHHQEFYQLLRRNGIKVLDLAPVFLRHRNDPAGHLYCRQDTHWSGRACAVTARLIAHEIANRPWLKAVPKRKFEAEERSFEITGDLWEALGDDTLAKEKLPLTFVRERTARGLVPAGSWRQSPIVLLGDSHNLIFHAGEDMQTANAGLPDQLARELGFPVDVVAVRGSGATPARENLMRRRDNLAGKRLVIWCFSAREFTESQSWRKIPVIRQQKAAR